MNYYSQHQDSSTLWNKEGVSIARPLISSWRTSWPQLKPWKEPRKIISGENTANQTTSANKNWKYPAVTYIRAIQDYYQSLIEFCLGNLKNTIFFVYWSIKSPFSQESPSPNLDLSFGAIEPSWYGPSDKNITGLKLTRTTSYPIT